MKIYIITSGEVHESQDIICAKYKFEDAIKEAEILAIKENDKMIKSWNENNTPEKYRRWLFVKESDTIWCTGLNIIEIIETEIT